MACLVISCTRNVRCDWRFADNKLRFDSFWKVPGPCLIYERLPAAFHKCSSDVRLSYHARRI
jgi:hypothetical protein